MKKIDELNQSVNSDPLTGLYNRRGMKLFIEEFVRMRTEFAVLAVDIDFFKKVNDTYGHDKGDVVLKRLASVMKYHFRDNDICCRSGGGVYYFNGYFGSGNYFSGCGTATKSG